MRFWKKRLQRVAAMVCSVALVASMMPTAAFATEPEPTPVVETAPTPEPSESPESTDAAVTTPAPGTDADSTAAPEATPAGNTDDTKEPVESPEPSEEPTDDTTESGEEGTETTDSTTVPNEENVEQQVSVPQTLAAAPAADGEPEVQAEEIPQTAQCTCDSKCTADSFNADCSICSADFGKCAVPLADNNAGITTLTENIVSYIGATGEPQTLDLNDDTNVSLLKDTVDSRIVSLEKKPWYVFSGSCSATTYELNRDVVNILLLDGSTLDMGAFCPESQREGVTLNIYAQSKGETAGKLILSSGIIGENDENDFTVNIYGGNIVANYIEATNITIAGGKIRNNEDGRNPFHSVIGTKEANGVATVKSITITGWADIDFDGTIGAIWSGAGRSNTVEKIHIGGSSNVKVRGRFFEAPGIGGDTGSVIGEIIIDGGTVVAQGGDGGPGIGVSSIAGNFGTRSGSLGTITIAGGTITAIGGDKKYDGRGGPGIGTTTTPFDSITISGGKVTATGGYNAAGIGSGINIFPNDICTGNSIVISGGEITATGGAAGAPGIGVCKNTTLRELTISGGTVTATGADAAPGIGSFGTKCSITDVIIENSNVTAEGDAGAGGDGIAGVGDVTITNAAITSNDVENSVQAGGTVRIEGKSADINLSGTKYAIDADNVTINQYATADLSGGDTAIYADNVTINQHATADLSGGDTAIHAGNVTINQYATADLSGGDTAIHADNVTIDQYATAYLSGTKYAIDAGKVTINQHATADLSGGDTAIHAGNVTINQYATAYLRGKNVAVDANSVTIGDTIMLWAYTSNGSKAAIEAKTTLKNESEKDNTYLATSGSEQYTSDLDPFVRGENKLTSAKWSFEDPKLTLKKEGNAPYCVDTKQSEITGNWACLYEAIEEIVISPADITIYTGGESGDTNNVEFPIPIYLVQKADGTTSELGDTKFILDGNSNQSYTAEDLFEVRYYNEEGEEITSDQSYGDFRAEITRKDAYKNNDITTEHEQAVRFEPGTLRIRYVSSFTEATQNLLTTQALKYSSENEKAEKAAQVESTGKAGILLPQNTTIYLNGKTQYVYPDNATDHIALFFDELLPETAGGDNTTYTNMLITHAANNGYTVSSQSSQIRYLDLVDTNNSNAWVSSSEGSEVFWPYPAGTDKDTEFQLLHFTGLHREYRMNGVSLADQVNASKIEVVQYTKTNTGIWFQIGESGFSPFALAWKAQDVPDRNPDTPTGGDDGNNDNNNNNTNTNNQTTTVNVANQAAAPAAAPAAAIPQTGDAMPVGLLGGLAAAAAAGFAALFVIRKRKQNG